MTTKETKYSRNHDNQWQRVFITMTIRDKDVRYHDNQYFPFNDKSDKGLQFPQPETQTSIFDKELPLYREPVTCKLL